MSDPTREPEHLRMSWRWKVSAGVLGILMAMATPNCPDRQQNQGPKTRGRRIVDHLMERPTEEEETKLDRIVRKLTERE